MQNNLKLKLSVAIGLLVIIIGIFYLSRMSIKPKAVFTPENYPTGTTVSLYDQVPPVFPADIILEDKELKYSGTVSTPGGKTQTTVSYISDKKAEDLVYLYKNFLSKDGWAVDVKDLRHSNYILNLSKDDEAVLLTISLTRDLKPLLTFQYTK